MTTTLFKDLLKIDDRELTVPQLSIKHYFCAVCKGTQWVKGGEQDHMIGTIDGESARLHVTCSPTPPTFFLND